MGCSVLCYIKIYISSIIIMIIIITTITQIIIIIIIIIVVIDIVVLLLLFIIIIIIIIIMIELTHGKTRLENGVEIEPQPVALDFKSLSEYSSRSK